MGICDVGCHLQKKESRYVQSGAVNVTGLMEDAKDELSTIGGWSKKSIMPAKYAKRFVQEQANKKLMEMYRNYNSSDIETNLNKD